MLRVQHYQVIILQTQPEFSCNKVKYATQSAFFIAYFVCMIIDKVQFKWLQYLHKTIYFTNYGTTMCPLL